VLNYFFEKNGLHPFFFFPLLHLVLCNHIVDKTVGGFSYLFFSLDLIFVLWLSWFLARLMCYFCPRSQSNLVITNSQVQYSTSSLYAV
jgi:hypothetical protein